MDDYATKCADELKTFTNKSLVAIATLQFLALAYWLNDKLGGATSGTIPTFLGAPIRPGYFSALIGTLYLGLFLGVYLHIAQIAASVSSSGGCAKVRDKLERYPWVLSPFDLRSMGLQVWLLLAAAMMGDLAFLGFGHLLGTPPPDCIPRVFRWIGVWDLSVLATCGLTAKRFFWGPVAKSRKTLGIPQATVIPGTTTRSGRADR